MKYYISQQQAYGIPVCRGQGWQRGHGQVGKGLGDFLRGVGRAVLPFIKSHAKPLGQLALNTGLEVLKDVSAGKVKSTHTKR